MGVEDIDQRLGRILSRPGNDRCSECDRQDNRPTWASFFVCILDNRKLGVLCCPNCHFLHQEVGADEFTLKGLKDLNDFTEEDLVALEIGGNAVVNAAYESQADRTERDGRERKKYGYEAYFFEKYVNISYFSDSAYRKLIIESLRDHVEQKSSAALRSFDLKKERDDEDREHRKERKHLEKAAGKEDRDRKRLERTGSREDKKRTSSREDKRKAERTSSRDDRHNRHLERSHSRGDRDRKHVERSYSRDSHHGDRHGNDKDSHRSPSRSSSKYDYGVKKEHKRPSSKHSSTSSPRRTPSDNSIDVRDNLADSSDEEADDHRKREKSRNASKDLVANEGTKSRRGNSSLRKVSSRDIVDDDEAHSPYKRSSSKDLLLHDDDDDSGGGGSSSSSRGKQRSKSKRTISPVPSEAGLKVMATKKKSSSRDLKRSPSRENSCTSLKSSVSREISSGDLTRSRSKEGTEKRGVSKSTSKKLERRLRSSSKNELSRKGSRTNLLNGGNPKSNFSYEDAESLSRNQSVGILKQYSSEEARPTPRVARRESLSKTNSEKVLRKKPTGATSPRAAPQRGMVRRGSVGNLMVRERHAAKIGTAVPRVAPQRGMVRRGSVGNLMVRERQSAQLGTVPSRVAPQRGMVRRGSVGNLMVQGQQSAQLVAAAPRRGMVRRGSVGNLLSARQTAQQLAAVPPVRRRVKSKEDLAQSKPQDFPGVSPVLNLGYGEDLVQDFPGVPAKKDLGYGPSSPTSTTESDAGTSNEAGTRVDYWAAILKTNDDKDILSKNNRNARRRASLTGY